MNTLLIQAMKKAGQIRTKLKLSMFDPVNIFDACTHLDLTVRFIDVSMEGMYVNQGNGTCPVILISTLRPLPRRVFTCAHELGHHLFGHGTKIDGLTEEGSNMSTYDAEEYLVDAFAGAFLMPVAAIEAEFSKRKWSIKNATPFQYYIISSCFGIGYSTLITQCKVNRLINEATAIRLTKQTPAKLLEQLIGGKLEKSHFKILDESTELQVVDLEVGNYLFLPEDMIVEGPHLQKLHDCKYGNIFVAKQPGIVHAISSKRSCKGYFVRVQNSGYVGLSENRHLEN